MNEPPKPGQRVRVARLGSTNGFLIKAKHLACRRVGVTGVVKSYVAGHGGDVWFVQHDDGDDVGAYMYTELEPVKQSGIFDDLGEEHKFAKLLRRAYLLGYEQHRIGPLRNHPDSDSWRFVRDILLGNLVSQAILEEEAKA